MPNLPLSDVLALMTVVLPVLVPLGGALYKRLLERLPSNVAAGLNESAKLAVHAMQANPSLATSAEDLAANICKEMHIPAKPATIAALVGAFQSAVGNDPDSETTPASASGDSPASGVGFVAPAPVVVPTPSNPGL